MVERSEDTHLASGCLLAAVQVLFHDDAVHLDEALGESYEGPPDIRRCLTTPVRTAGRRWLVDQAQETEGGRPRLAHPGRNDGDLPGCAATGCSFDPWRLDGPYGVRAHQARP